MSAATSIAASLPDWVPSIWQVLDFPATKWLFLVFALVMPLASLLTWAREARPLQLRFAGSRG